MYGQKIGMATLSGIDTPISEQIRILKRVGFEAFATLHSSNANYDEYRRIADECGMVYEYIHAPFANAARMWEDGAEEFVNELIACVDICAKYRVPKMVVHAYIGFEPKSVIPEPRRSIGIKNYRTVCEYARDLGVKVAIENTEGEEYLEALMTELADLDNVGFCWDTGHQMCYNFDRDMAALYGDRLLVTHLNDNLGVRDASGEITWIDDLHLLPFDGIGDFDLIARRIAESAPLEILMFELNKNNRPDRLCNERYVKMSTEEYFTEAYIRACRVATLVKKYRKGLK